MGPVHATRRSVAVPPPGIIVSSLDGSRRRGLPGYQISQRGRFPPNRIPLDTTPRPPPAGRGPGTRGARQPIPSRRCDPAPTNGVPPCDKHRSPLLAHHTEPTFAGHRWTLARRSRNPAPNQDTKLNARVTSIPFLRNRSNLVPGQRHNPESWQRSYQPDPMASAPSRATVRLSIPTNLSWRSDSRIRARRTWPPSSPNPRLYSLKSGGGVSGTLTKGERGQRGEKRSKKTSDVSVAD